MKFREYLEQFLNEAEELIPSDSQFKDDTSSDSVDSVGEAGVEMVPSSEVPKDAVDIESETAEAKWIMKGAKTPDEAWEEYNKVYIPKLLQNTVETNGIGKGQFYTLGITSLKAGKLGNADTHDTEKDDEKLSRSKEREAKKNAFLLIGQCRVKDIGVMEGFHKPFVLGVRIKLTGDSVKKKIGTWLEKKLSKLDGSKKKFKHIKTAAQDFGTVLGENEFAVPVHWIPRLREAIEKNISKKHMAAEKEKEAAKESGEKYIAPGSTHVATGAEGKIKVGTRHSIKLPPLGKK